MKHPWTASHGRLLLQILTLLFGLLMGGVINVRGAPDSDEEVRELVTAVRAGRVAAAYELWERLPGSLRLASDLLAESEEASVRRLALETVGTAAVAPDALVVLVAARLDAEELDEVEQALRALTMLGCRNPSALTFVAGFIRNTRRNPALRGEALKLLSRDPFRAPLTEGDLVAVLEERNQLSGRREMMTWAGLTTFIRARRGTEPALLAALERTYSETQDEPFAGLLLEAIQALTGKQIHELTRQALESTDLVRRAAALEGLTDLGADAEPVAGRLEERLDAEPVPILRVLGLTVLAVALPARATEFEGKLLAFADSSDLAVGLRGQAIRALSRLSTWGPRVRPTLMSLRADAQAHYWLRMSAALTLGMRDSKEAPAAIRVLGDVLQDGSVPLRDRRWIPDALTELQQERAAVVDLLRRIRSDLPESVRRAADLALYTVAKDTRPCK